MNTINITIDINGETNTITYTELEILKFIERAKETDAIQQVADKYDKIIRDNRTHVRDFFSEGEWQNGETTINKGDVNMLLEEIGSHKLTTKYLGTFSLHGTFLVEAEDEDEATQMIENDIDISFYGGDIDVDNIEVNDIDEDN